MLRWTNKLAEDEISMRPDATITSIKQADLGENIGFGEAKTAQPTCDKAALCLDFVRLAYLGKKSIDNGCLEASLCFQIHGFRIVFYLTRLDYDKLYTMTQIGTLDFPRSLDDMSSFTCPKNLRTLLQVTKAFWQHCHKAKTPSLQTKSIDLGFVLHFLDSHKDRRRECPDNFGN